VGVQYTQIKAGLKGEGSTLEKRLVK